MRPPRAPESGAGLRKEPLLANCFCCRWYLGSCVVFSLIDELYFYKLSPALSLWRH